MKKLIESLEESPTDRTLDEATKGVVADSQEVFLSLQETEEALSWLCEALRDQATGHPETLTMWNSAETVRRIQRARAVIKKHSGQPRKEQ